MTNSPYDGGSLVVRLRATPDTVDVLRQRKNGRISAFMGNAVHQSFHDSVSDATADLLHDTSIQVQPFAASTLFRWRLDIPLYGEIYRGEMGWVRFVGLHPVVMAQLDAYRRSNPRWLEIDYTPWQVLTTTWEDHLYAGRFSAAQRWQTHRRLGLPRLIWLRFFTPTYFKSRGVEPYLKPEPRLVFAEGLRRRWEAFYPHVRTPEGFSDFVTEHLREKRRVGFATQSVMVKGPKTGFTGDVIYALDLPEVPDPWQVQCAQFLSVLTEYATYAGGGEKKPQWGWGWSAECVWFGGGRLRRITCKWRDLTNGPRTQKKPVSGLFWLHERGVRQS